MRETPPTRSHNALASLIFLSRWLQAPLYLGLIVAQGVYVYHFLIELGHLLEKAPHIDEKDDHAHGAGTDRCGHDRQSAHHGHRWRLRNVRLPPAPRGPSGSTRMALPRQCRRAQGQARHGADRHLLHSSPENLHRNRNTGSDRANRSLASRRAPDLRRFRASPGLDGSDIVGHMPLGRADQRITRTSAEIGALTRKRLPFNEDNSVRL